MKPTFAMAGAILSFVLLAGCGSSPAPQTSVAAEQPVTLPPAVMPEPTLPPPPLPTATVTPTALPEGTLFRDDFVGALQPGWTVENEMPNRWKITDDGRLQIIAEDGGMLAGQPQSNVFWRDLPQGEFAVTVHVQTRPTVNFQQAAIFLFEDINNYVAINRGFCAPCFPGQDGNGIFMDYRINGQWGSYKLRVEQPDVYLRLVFKDNVISAYYALSPDTWERLGRFGNYFQFQRVGLGATNLDREGVNEDLVASYDYFEITKP